jgi:dUTP pyrophosphatase
MTEGTIKVRLVRLAHGRGLALPAYQSDTAAGLDLVAAVERKKPMVLGPGERALVPTGLVMELPPGYEGQVRPRSGLALKHGVTVLNSPGTIDSDYRGEVKVLLVNLGSETFEIVRGERIAQLVVAPVSHATLVSARTLSSTDRGAGGFGSTRMSTSPARQKMPPRASTKKSSSQKGGKRGASSR